MTQRITRVTKVPKLVRRRREGHKGDYGHVLIVGGSQGMIGAPALAANAALRGGAGLVTFAAPRTVQLAVATLCSCATSVPLDCAGDSEPSPAAVRQMLAAAARADVLAVGPGMGVGRGQKSLVLAAVEQEKPLVLDADGLNNLAAIDDWPRRRCCPLVVTPHPGEFARLTGLSVKAIQASRQSTAIVAVQKWAKDDAPPLVLVLEGAGTVVTDGRRVFINRTGNPGMATGGSGDVLTGLLAALIGQGLEPFDAACLAVHLHGRSGDLAARAFGEVSLIASDLLDYLPVAISNVSK